MSFWKRAAFSGVEVRGKTGTSQDFRDAWFIGYTPQVIAGFWMGNLNYTPMERVVGVASGSLADKWKIQHKQEIKWLNFIFIIRL